MGKTIMAAAAVSVDGYIAYDDGQIGPLFDCYSKGNVEWKWSDSGADVSTLTDEGSAGVRRAYPEHKLARLTALKSAWDPDNVFRLNHHVAPASS